MIEPEEDRVCQWSWIGIEEDDVDKEKNIVIFCKEYAEYRITIQDREVMNEAGEWEKETRQEYFCKKHFDEVYRYPPSSVHPYKWTFRRMGLKAVGE